MHANVTFPLTLVSNKLKVPYFSIYFNRIKIVTAFKCIFEQTVPKFLENFGNHYSQDFHKTDLPARSGILVLQNNNNNNNNKTAFIKRLIRKGQSAEQYRILNYKQIIHKNNLKLHIIKRT